MNEKNMFKLSNLTGTIFFQTQDQEEETFHQKDLVQLYAYGMSVDGARPFLLLQDEKHECTLPVAINPLEAGITLSQSSRSATPVTTHKFTETLIKSLGIEVKQCVFVEIKNVHQYVRLYLTGHPAMNSIKLRADEAMSLCLYLNVPLFATRAFIAKSKVLNAEIANMAHDANRSGGYIN